MNLKRNALFSHFVETRDGKWRWLAVLNVVTTVQSHFCNDGRVARTKVKRPESVACEVCLQFTVNMEVERQATEVQSERVLGSVIDCRVCRSERVLDLLNRWENFGGIEMKPAVPQSDEFHVENFDGL
jgi:hypothetical protein